jgi:hypothetical protein
MTRQHAICRHDIGSRLDVSLISPNRALQLLLAVAGKLGRTTHGLEHLEDKQASIVVLVISKYDQSETVIHKNYVFGVKAADLAGVPHKWDGRCSC